MKKIKIDYDLSKEVEKAFYEYERYKDFLETVSFEENEAWYESWEYFSNLYLESFFNKTILINSLKKEYRLEEKSFIVSDFKYNELYFTSSKEEAEEQGHYIDRRNGIEEFNHTLNRIYSKDYLEEGITHPTRNITFQVTDECNLRCTYCYQHNKKSHLMNFETAKALIDKLFNNELKEYLNTDNVLGFIFEFIGGEPLLNIDLINEITNYFIRKTFIEKKSRYVLFCMFSICSNGLLHFDPKVQQYLSKHFKHVSYDITVDGNKELHDKCRLDCNNCGSYDRAISAVNDYRNTFNKIMGSKITISPDNVLGISDALIDMLQHDYRNININYVYEKGWNNSHATILYYELKKLTDYLKENNLLNETNFSILSNTVGQPEDETRIINWCGGTGLMLAMDYKGDLYPCLRYMESSVGDSVPPYIIGNIFSNNYDKEKIEILNSITRQSQSSKECLECPISSGCGWCSAYNYEITGTPNKRVTYICPMHKARVLSCKYYFNNKNEEFNLNIPKEWALEIIPEKEYDLLINGET